MRDRLIELLESTGMVESESRCEIIAQELLAAGVIVLPCKVGDKVYRIWSAGNHGKSVAEFVVTNVSQIMENTWVIRYKKQSKILYSTPTIYQCNFNDIGKTVFLTKEEAEKALAERREG